MNMKSLTLELSEDEVLVLWNLLSHQHVPYDNDKARLLINKLIKKVEEIEVMRSIMDHKPAVPSQEQKTEQQ